MAEKEADLTNEAERLVLDELGLSWKRLGRDLSVHLYVPNFKIETLSPASPEYTAHFAMDKAWAYLVKTRAALLAEAARARDLEAERDALKLTLGVPEGTPQDVIHAVVQFCDGSESHTRVLRHVIEQGKRVEAARQALALAAERFRLAKSTDNTIACDVWAIEADAAAKSQVPEGWPVAIVGCAR